MAKFDSVQIEKWSDKVTYWIVANLNIGVTRLDVKTGVDAWTIAHRCGITEEAYKDRNVVDAHIQTALEVVFPNAVFKDKKRY